MCKFPGPKLWAASVKGDTVRDGLNTLSITHPKAWREICGHLKNGRAENDKDPKHLNEEHDRVVQLDDI
jgi:hypothetical protein